MRPRPRLPFPLIDRYVLGQTLGSLAVVLAVTVSLMLVEHLPRLLDVVRLSGAKGHVVGEMLLALIPEWAGIGGLFGLYFAIALTVRRMAVRNELAAMEAMGIGPRRWARQVVLVATVMAAFLLLNQGWLMPAGEQALARVGKAMQRGEYGYTLSAGQFVDLGQGTTLQFMEVSDDPPALRDVFLQTPSGTISASSGQIGFTDAGELYIDLANGLLVDGRQGRTLAFRALRFVSGSGRLLAMPQVSSPPRKETALPALVRSADPADRAAGYARLLWPLFALILPMIALVAGRPPLRSTSFAGLLAGGIVVVGFVRSTSFLESWGGQMAEAAATGLALVWVLFAFALLHLQRRLGAGFIDTGVVGAMRKVRNAWPWHPFWHRA